MKSIIIVIFFLLIFFSLSAADDLTFKAEKINFRLERDCFYVGGTYYFENQTSEEINRLLFYPFPMDSTYATPDSLFAVNLTDNRSVICSATEKGFSFTVNIETAGVDSIRLGYRQLIKGSKAEYILTSTASWKRPLEKAEYTLTIPAGLKIQNFSYLPDRMETKGEELIFFWEKTNFMPDQNFVVEFEK